MFDFSLRGNQPLEESWDITIQIIKGKHACRVARAQCWACLCPHLLHCFMMRIPPGTPSMSSTSSDGCLWWLPVILCPPDQYYECLRCLASHMCPAQHHAWNAQLGGETGAAGRHEPQRWDEGCRPSLRNLWQISHWARWLCWWMQNTLRDEMALLWLPKTG